MLNQRKLLPFIPVFVDGLTLAAMLLWLPTAVSRFSIISGGNAALLSAVFLLMWAGVFIIRKLQPREGDGRLTIPAILLDRRLHIASAVAFALVFVTMLASQFGYFDAIFQVDTLTLGEGESASFFVFAPWAWLGFAFLYVVFLILKVTPTIPPEKSRYGWLTLFALLAVNAMLFVMTTQFAAWIQTWGMGGDILNGLLAFALLALLFGPPRWIYLSRQPDVGGDLTSLALWVYCAWRVMG